MVTSASPADGTYAAIYQAAIDVAHAAERAELSRAKSRSRARTYSRHGANDPSQYQEDADGSGRHLERMTQSFHSDLSTMSRTSTDGGGETDHPVRMSLSTHTLRDTRGRTLRRTALATPPSEDGTVGNLPTSRFIDGLPDVGGPTEMRENRSKSRSLSIVRGASQAGKSRGRKAAGVAFMSLALLLRFRGEVSMTPAARSGASGRVLLATPVALSNHGALLGALLGTDPDSPRLPSEPPDIQRIIGRISAWACTTLYLTSRLPQIWKNVGCTGCPKVSTDRYQFQRRSVEGLSILLFLFAFIGNLTYVCSILLNPSGDADPADAGHYLLESLPYVRFVAARGLS